MAWTNSIRAAVSGLTSLYPQVFAPLNGENLGQANFADGVGRLSTALESLRSVSWHSNEITIAGTSVQVTGETAHTWQRASQSVTFDGVSCRIPYWETIAASNPVNVLLIDVPHPRLADVYLSGYTINSRSPGAHASIPLSADRFKAALIEYRTDAMYFYRSDDACDTSSPANYDAKQEWRVTIAAGGGLRPQLNQYRYALALRAETGGLAVLGRQVRGVLFHFSKDA